MPELPEVETMRRGILPVEGGRIERVVFPRRPLRPLETHPQRPRLRQRLAGRRIERVERLGKRIVLALDDQQRLIVEPRMTGLLLLDQPPNALYLRAGLQLAESPAAWLWYWDQRGLGQIKLLSPEQFQQQLGPTRLGPDALDVPPDFWHNCLGNRRRPVKVALMDQQLVAGIGNLYASEILFVARIHPATPCHRISRRRWRDLHGAVQEVLHEAIRYEGSTLADGTYRNALNRPGNYQSRHRVYARAGKPCPRCSQTTIRRLVQAQRSTFYCPRCQRSSS